jgi:IMP dehydrogenase/GMP reductase
MKITKDIDNYKETFDWWQPIDPGYDTDKRKVTFTYYGMSTHVAQDTYEKNIKNYRASEGTKIVVKYKGELKQVIQELLGGIRSCCCYIGSDSIKNMPRCAEFCIVNTLHNNKNPILGV